MKFRLLRCFAVAFVCVIETCGFSVWAEDTVTCGTGEYLDSSYINGGMCVSCPYGNAVAFVGAGYPFSFQNENSTSIDQCSVALNSDYSSCNTGSNVVYTYDSATEKYKYNPKAPDYRVVPDGGAVLLIGIKEDEVIDHCAVTCPAGYYRDKDNNNNDVCMACPANDDIGSGKRFSFVTPDSGEAKSISDCIAKLQLGSCSRNGTDVEYRYSPERQAYVRFKEWVITTSQSVKADPFPGETEMNKDFCKRCPKNAPYNVNGVCDICGAGYYLKELDTGKHYMCEKCPAGYYCPGKTDDETTSQKEIECPSDTYSTGGKAECEPCPDGTSTNGVKGCVSRDACEFKMSGLSVKSNGDWVVTFLGNNVKIESLNRSVVKTISGVNTATTAVARPGNEFFDEE